MVLVRGCFAQANSFARRAHTAFEGAAGQYSSSRLAAAFSSKKSPEKDIWQAC